MSTPPAPRRSVLQEVENWKATAEQESRNRDYYRSLVVQIGEMLGPVAYTQDDGGIVTDVLCAKVPGLVAELLNKASAMGIKLP